VRPLSSLSAKKPLLRPATVLRDGVRKLKKTEHQWLIRVLPSHSHLKDAFLHHYLDKTKALLNESHVMPANWQTFVASEMVRFSRIVNQKV
jgi:hypothetical protein